MESLWLSLLSNGYPVEVLEKLSSLELPDDPNIEQSDRSNDEVRTVLGPEKLKDELV